MNIEDWKNLPIEVYTAAGFAILSLFFFILWLSARHKIRLHKKRQIADLIEIEETGKTDRWFRVFTQTIPQVFWIRSESETLYVSPHFENLTGHPASIINHFPHGLLQICHPEEKKQVADAHQTFLSSKTGSLDLSFRVRKSGQHYIWIRERIFIHSHTSGKRYFVGLLEDITEKHERIEQINDQRLLLDNILETNDEGIYCLDRNLNCIFWNKEMENISGLSKEQVINQGNHLKTFPHLEDNGVADMIRSSLEGKISPPKEFPYNLSTNRKGYTIDKYFPLKNSRDQIIGVLGIVKDITEEVARDNILEKTQEHYGLTLKALNDGLWDINLIHRSVIFSDHWFKMLGYSPDELSSSLDTLMNRLYSSDDQQVIEDMLLQLEQGQSVSKEVRMTTKQGKIKWMLIRGSVTEKNQSGIAVRAMGTQTDITRRKEYELELVEALKKAEESDRLKSSFLANMSHEIRTPLNAIVGFTDLISNCEEMDQNELINFKTQIRSNTDYLLAMIEDIVLLSMIEADQLNLHLETFSLLEIIKKVAQTEYKKFGKPKADQVKLSLHASPNLKDLQITSDKSLLEKSLAKIINNGLNYTEKGKVTVGYTSDENEGVSIYIKDEGCGIHPDYQTKIFEHFTQLESGLTRSSRGTGLGLGLVKQILKKLDGHIELESSPGKGSTFTITLPLHTP